MWEPQPLTTLRASKACRGENFTFTFTLLFNKTMPRWVKFEFKIKGKLIIYYTLKYYGKIV
jgi:hypothetical protein